MTDPFKLLNVPRDFSLDQLRENYKRIALKVHPDKGGTDELFQLVTTSYKKLLKYYHKKIEKDYHDLKSEFKQFESKQQPTAVQAPMQPELKDKFNTAFEENRMHNVYDRGYGARMAQSTNIREDIDVPAVLKSFKLKQFNKAFENQEIEKDNRRIMVYKPPEPTPICKKLAFSELGVDKIRDFSGENETLKKLNYMDYMAAHSTSRLIDPELVKQRNDYKNITELERDRSTTSMSPEQDRMYKKYDQRLQEKERRRLQNLEEQDRMNAEHHRRINMALGRSL